MINLFKPVWRFLLDLLFPIRCLGNCGRFDIWLCPECMELLVKNGQGECPVCRQIQTRGQTCLNCKSKTRLDGLFVYTDYQIPLAERLIQVLKYQYAESIGKLLGQLIASAELLNHNPIFKQKNKWLVMPVPLHRFRKNERGFNQSEIIARSFAQKLDIKIKNDILFRTVYTQPQAKLKRSKRLNNLHDKIKTRTGVELSGQNVIIIDDVATTTATLNECAKALKKSGAKEVWGMVFARSKD